MLGYLYHFGTSDIPVSSVGFLGIAVALLAEPPSGSASVRCSSAHSSSARRTACRPTSSIPSLAGNLTYMIQGLVVLFVGADVLILSVWGARRKFRHKTTSGTAGASA